MRIWLAVAVLIGLATDARAQEGREGAVAFIEGVYGSYREDQPWPIDDQRLDEVFSPAMATLIRRDRELSGDDLPYLDADPICQCQDFENIAVQEAAAEWRDRRVVVSVRFVNGGEAHQAEFLLAGNPVRGWRIDDVLNPGYPGLAETLAEANRRREAGVTPWREP